MFISLTIIENTSLTLIRDLAEASINGQPHSSANAIPVIKRGKKRKFSSFLELRESEGKMERKIGRDIKL